MAVAGAVPLKRQLRRLEGDITAALALVVDRSDSTDDAFSRFEAMMDRVLTDWDVFRDTWDRLDTGESEGFPTDAWRTTYDNLRGQVNEAIAALATLRRRRAVPAKNPATDGQSADDSLRAHISLPRIAVPKFSGDLLKWTAFRDTFKSLVHQNATLTGTQKFHYLCDALAGEPAGLISGLTMQDCSYEQAWKSLLQQYDNPRILASLYIRRLLDCDMSKAKSSYDRYSKFLSSVGESVESFRNLKFADEANVLLSILALRALDPDTRREFETQHASTEFPAVQEIIQYVRRRKTALTLAEERFLSPHTTRARGSKVAADVPRHATLLSTASVPPVNSPSHAPKTQPSSQAPRRPRPCVACSGFHPLFLCPQFRGWPLERRQEFVKAWRGCSNCLGHDHKLRECRSKMSCRTCGGRHHTLIHPGSGDSAQPVRSPRPSGKASHDLVCTSTLHQAVIDEPQHVLGTAQALLSSSSVSSTAAPVRVLLDSGSQHSFVTRRVVERMNFTLKPYLGSIVGMGGAPVSVDGILECNLQSTSSKPVSVFVRALVVKHIASSVPSKRLGPLTSLQLPRTTLADPQFAVPGPVDFLAGVDLYYRLLNGTPRRLEGTGLHMQPTILGTVIAGTTETNLSPSPKSPDLSLTATQDDELLKAVEAFSALEEPVPARLTDPNDLRCEQMFIRTLSRTLTGRYIVRLPLIPGPVSPGFNRDAALRRFYALERKLSRDASFRQRYVQFMSDYESLGHMSPTNQRVDYIIPHHGIMQGPKLRVVFDASCPSTGASLNEILQAGPKLQPDLGLILTRFRKHPVALTTDIVKMYRQVLIHPDDRHLQHIFWRADPSHPLKEYALNTVTYGITSSAYHAIRAVQQVVQDHGASFKTASRHVMESMYVDDILCGADSPAEATRLHAELTDLLGLGGFELAKWASNVPEVLPEGADSPTLCLTDKLEASIKVLGLSWDPRTDSFLFPPRAPREVSTKRELLSVIARLFDPLGFVSPVVFHAKTTLQEVWKVGSDWDDPLPATVARRWRRFTKEWPTLAEFRVPRHVHLTRSRHRLVGFCDASTLGYAAVVYLQVSDADRNTRAFLIKSKTKVAPHKFVTVSRLELCGALLLQRTVDSIAEAFPSPHQPPAFFTDSAVVLAWLRTPFHELKVFEANRVATILDSSSHAQWSHVRAEDNPADIASRGRTPGQLLNDRMWWDGPPWLCDPSWLDAAPSQPTLACTEGPPSPDTSWMTRFSSLQRLIGAVAYILRWPRRGNSANVTPAGPLTAHERTDALLRCVKQTQCAAFGCASLESPALRSHRALRLFLDSQGILRVGGRLTHADLSPSHRHPALLPRKHHLAVLLIRDAHERHFHAGPTLTASLVQTRVWVPGAYQLAKKIIKKCITCRLAGARPSHPRMGDLPPERVHVSRPFATVGVDLTGPFLVRRFRRRNAPTDKTYACLFVCLASKAVHLELVSSLSTASFLEALDRFIARRGLPTVIMSDHGTNFVGASRFLKAAFATLRTWESQIVHHLAPRGVEWKFTPPRAPHFGGLWEAAVKSTKRLLACTVGTQPFLPDELLTILVRIEGILNSRPLCPLRDDPANFDILTPGHFLIGEPLFAVPSIPTNTMTSRSRWKGTQQTIRSVWNRWQLEYLHHLQQRVKWKENRKNLKVGDLVIMIERRTPTCVWPVARVAEVHPGSDGVTRVVSLRTPCGQHLRRSVHTLAPLFDDAEPSPTDAGRSAPQRPRHES